MSDYKNFEKYLAGEWYPGCEMPQTEWRKNWDAYMAGKTVIPAPVVVKKTRVRVKGRTKKKYRNDYNKRRRAEAIKQGICADCYREEATDGTTTCRGCRAKKRLRTQRRYYATEAA